MSHVVAHQGRQVRFGEIAAHTATAPIRGVRSLVEQWVHGNRYRLLRHLLLIVLAMVVGAALFSFATAPDRYDPLGEYPPQVVKSRVPGISGPAVYAGEDVVIVGLKCNDSTGTVRVEGESQWQSINPRGRYIANPSGVRDLPPGCTQTPYVNDVPRSIEERVQRTGHAETWSLTGSDTPIRADGFRGEPRVWVTANFRVIARYPTELGPYVPPVVR